MGAYSEREKEDCSLDVFEGVVRDVTVAVVVVADIVLVVT